jgi:hypothetical protein
LADGRLTKKDRNPALPKGFIFLARQDVVPGVEFLRRTAGLAGRRFGRGGAFRQYVGVSFGRAIDGQWVLWRQRRFKTGSWLLKMACPTAGTLSLLSFCFSVNELFLPTQSGL